MIFENNSYNIYNDDCFKIMEKLEDNSIDFILADIPYEAKKETNFKTIKDHTKKSGETEYCCMDFGDWDEDFDVEKAIKESLRVLKNKSSMVIYCNWKQLNFIHECYLKYCPKKFQREPRIGVWQKTNPSVFNMQRMAIQPYEFFIWLGIGSNMTFNNQNIVDGKTKPERLYFESSTQRGFHPTLKNVEHMEHLIKTYTNPDDIVLDFTCGSGTTGVACIKTGRRFIGIDNSAIHFKTATERLENTYKEINKE